MDVAQVDNFRKSLEFVLRWEGGYVNDAADPGGETKYGIAKRSHPDVDIKNLTPQQAMDIYADEYWGKAGCDALPFPYCTVVFDSAVNSGVSQALFWLRKAENIRQYLNLRRMHYYELVNQRPTSSKFLAGWLNRLNDLTKFVDINLVSLDQDQQAPRWGSLN